MLPDKVIVQVIVMRQPGLVSFVSKALHYLKNIGNFRRYFLV